MAIDFTNFFTHAGLHFNAGNTVITAMLTTIADEIEDARQLYGTESIEVSKAADGMADQLLGFQEGTAGFLSSIITEPLTVFLTELIRADNALPNYSLRTVLDELIKQMEDNSESLDASTPAITPSYNGSNTGDGVIVTSIYRPDGKINEFIYAEDVECKVTSRVDGGEATITMAGEEATPLLQYDWPKGSGSSVTATSYVGDSGANLLTNGLFNDEETLAEHVPDGWIADVATLGTTLKMSDVEVQTITVTGSPSAGHYWVNWVDGAGNQHSTEPLAYNASGSTLQTRLRALPGLGSITVATTGTTPNFTHTITMTDVPNPAQFTITNNTTGGTITPATSTAGSANVIRGARAVEFDSNASELTSISQEVSVSPTTQYAFSSFWKTDSAPAAGVVTVALVDGLGATANVLSDEAGTACSFTIDATALTTSFSQHTGVFRTPDNLPDAVYLRIYISTAVSNTSSLYLAEAILVPMTLMYNGGWSFAWFTGETEWDVDDLATVPPTNDRAGALHEWMNRAFNLMGSNLLLPTDTGGSETQADTLIT